MTTEQPVPGATGPTISISQIFDRLTDPDLTIVDARPTAAFNGWRLRGESRGGHVPGAVAFPSAWLANVDEAEIDRQLGERGIVAGRSIVLVWLRPG